MNVFYMVVRNPKSDSSRMPTKTFDTEISAMEEAERLCIKEKDKFYVLKAMSYCDNNRVSWGYFKHGKSAGEFLHYEGVRIAQCQNGMK